MDDRSSQMWGEGSKEAAARAGIGMEADEARCELLGAAFLHLLGLRPILPERPLSADERRERGGRLFPGGPGLVNAVGRTLQAEPARFGQGGAAQGQALLLQQREACRLRALRDCLLDLARLAGDAYLEVQSGAIAQAQAILQRERERQGDTAEAERTAAERRLCLVPAYFIVHHYQKTLLGRRAAARERRTAARSAAAAAPLQTSALAHGEAPALRTPAPSPAPRPRSPAAARAARRAREERRAALLVRLRAAALRLGPHPAHRDDADAVRSAAGGALAPFAAPALQLLPPEDLARALSPAQRAALRRLLL